MKRICFLLSFFCVISFSVSSQTKKEPLFGKSHSSYTVSSSSLKGAVFYLVSGHGGPDPGCIGKYQGKELHEDEYAYDIILWVRNFWRGEQRYILSFRMQKTVSATLIF